jgi:hypothetical protein
MKINFLKEEEKWGLGGKRKKNEYEHDLMRR